MSLGLDLDSIKILGLCTMVRRRLSGTSPEGVGRRPGVLKKTIEALVACPGILYRSLFLLLHTFPFLTHLRLGWGPCIWGLQLPSAIVHYDHSEAVSRDNQISQYPLHGLICIWMKTLSGIYATVQMKFTTIKPEVFSKQINMEMKMEYWSKAISVATVEVVFQCDLSSDSMDIFKYLVASHMPEPGLLLSTRMLLV